MAVQARYAAHAFPHDPRATACRPSLDNGAPAFLGDLGCVPVQQQQMAAAVGGDTVFSDVTCANRTTGGDSGCAAPRKRARVVGDDDVDGGGAGLIMDLDGHQALLPPVPPQSRTLGAAAASCSGRSATAAPASGSLLAHLYRYSLEVDALVRVQNERLRAGLQEARRRHARAVAAAAERAAARRLRGAEEELRRALSRVAELEEALRRAAAEAEAWRGVARGHEAAAAGLRAALDDLLLRPPRADCAGGAGGGDAEDARSCCFELDGEGVGTSGGGAAARACRSCGEAEARVLLLPCRHLCLCPRCEPGVEACPVCAATKNASLHVLLP